MQVIRRIGIELNAGRNAALHDLTRRLPPSTLIDKLGYSAQVINRHGKNAAAPVARYVQIRSSALNPPVDDHEAID